MDQRPLELARGDRLVGVEDDIETVGDAAAKFHNTPWNCQSPSIWGYTWSLEEFPLNVAPDSAEPQLRSWSM